MQPTRRALLWLAFGSLALFSACSQNPDPDHVPPPDISQLPQRPVPTADPVSPPIQPGESLDVFVLEDESFNGRYTVRAEGDIILPKIGRVDIGGKSIPSAEAAVKKVLEVSQLNSASVIIDRPGLPAKITKPVELEKPSVEVFISGKVAQPGRYTISSVGNAPPSVYQSILQAGGFSRWAYPKKVYVLRRGGDGRLSRIDANIDAISSGEQPDIALFTGDIVTVPEKKAGF